MIVQAVSLNIVTVALGQAGLGFFNIVASKIVKVSCVIKASLGEQ